MSFVKQLLGSVACLSTLAAGAEPGYFKEEQRIAPPQESLGDFGSDVFLSGTRMIVGAQNSNQAYVYDLVDGSWALDAILEPSDEDSGMSFGYDVSVGGNYAIVGAYQADVDGMSQAGAAYVFARNETGAWNEMQRIYANDAAASDRFGNQVIVGDLPEDGSPPEVYVANYRDDDIVSGSGSIYRFVFDQGSESFIQSKKYIFLDEVDGTGLALHATNGYCAYRAIDVKGNLMAIPCYKTDPLDSGVADSGNAYVFSKVGSSFSNKQELVPSDAEQGMYFGWSMAIVDDTTVVVGARDASGGGAAYVFELAGGSWSQTQKLTHSEGHDGAKFGVTVAAEGDLIAIGSQSNSVNVTAGDESGSVTVFKKDGAGVWQEHETIRIEETADGDSAGSYFGYSVKINNGNIVVGARRFNPADAPTNDNGAITGGVFWYDLVPTVAPTAAPTVAPTAPPPTPPPTTLDFSAGPRVASLSNVVIGLQIAALVAALLPTADP